MSQVSTIGKLPMAIREEVDNSLIANGFSNYLGLTAELNLRGFPDVSKSALHRYGQKLKRRIQIEREFLPGAAGCATAVVIIDRSDNCVRLLNVNKPASSVIDLLKAL